MSRFIECNIAISLSFFLLTTSPKYRLISSGLECNATAVCPASRSSSDTKKHTTTCSGMLISHLGRSSTSSSKPSSLHDSSMPSQPRISSQNRVTYIMRSQPAVEIVFMNESSTKCDASTTSDKKAFWRAEMQCGSTMARLSSTFTR